ncbi:hypothetical protein MANES_07G141501v8 [Manihot esculenta]|uniref:Uncharacterized protein n=1 Tax=Manihot esculenta TaxID=3983 RepID=A0ACB7HHY9_MANES|nr:hypothetical protein MANES_07G141501v8 [Manihot esculenta]
MPFEQCCNYIALFKVFPPFFGSGGYTSCSMGLYLPRIPRCLHQTILCTEAKVTYLKGATKFS